MGRFFRAVRLPFLCLLCLAIAAIACLYPVFGVEQKKTESERAGILRVWQIDSFEGGRGSRALFLNSVARIYENKSNMFVLITTHTPESAANAVAEGQLPDVISYGPGLEFIADIARPLPGYTFDAGKLGGETFAYPWCRGSYFLLTGEGDFSDVTPQNTVFSIGRGASVTVAAAVEGYAGTYAAEPSVQAYVDLIGGKYRYMIGTQRDVWRLRTRAYTFSARPLTAFSDLFQYVSVCAEDGGQYSAALEFVEVLLSKEVQESVTSIGMLSIDYTIYTGDEIFMAAEREPPRSTVSAFLTLSARRELEQLAEETLNGDKSSAKKLKNCLL